MTRCRVVPGFRVGRLVALERLPNSGRHSLWRCRCDCGKEHDVLGQCLTHPTKPTQSCGCTHVEARITNLHRARAARNAQITKLRQEREAGRAPPVKQTTAVREDFRVRQAREERERQAAALDLAACLGYIGGK